VSNQEDPQAKVDYYFAQQPTDRLDFEDITTVNVTVELAGGLCNLRLGSAEVWFTRVPECGASFKMIRNLTEFSNTFSLPAHRFEYSFGMLKSDSSTFNLAVADYLVRARNDSGEFDLTNHTSQNLITRARFEYHPYPTMQVSLSNAEPFTCASKVPDFLKIESRNVTNATITLLEIYSLTATSSATCTYIQGTINVTNNLGGDVDSVPLLSVCREACPLEIKSDPIIEVKNHSVCVINQPDGAKASLVCPAGGTIVSVPFAFYGVVPSNGTCASSITNDRCVAASAWTIVNRECIGKTNCSFAVKSATFNGIACTSNGTRYFSAKVICTVVTTIGYENARVELPLQIGDPNRVEPYFKTLVARMQVPGYINDLVQASRGSLCINCLF
jgi:hypothetical protein